MSTARVVVIGDALVDEMRDEHGSVDAPGGSALNVAVGLAILGVPATLIAMVGDDADGDQLRDYLAGFDVELLAAPSALGTGRAVSDRSAGEPTYAFSDAALGRSIRYDDTMLAAIAAAPLVAISSYPLDTPAEEAALVAALAGRDNVLVDPNPRSGFLRDRAAFTAALERLAATSRLVKIGDEDARLLYNRGVESVADAFAALGARVVLATEGANGATVLVDGERIHRPIATDARPVIDTMGAGDATFASIIARLAREPGALDASAWSDSLGDAMGIAAETIRHAGGRLRVPGSQPTR